MMPRTLSRSQVEDSAVEVDNRQLPFCEKVPKLLDGRLADVRDQTELPRQPLEFLDRRAAFLHARLGVKDPLGHVYPEAGQDHAQAGQGTGLTLLLAVERKLCTHSIAVFPLDPPRSCEPFLCGALVGSRT